MFSTGNLWQCLNLNVQSKSFSPHCLLLGQLSCHQHNRFPAVPAAALLAAFVFLLWLSLNILPHKCRTALMRSAMLIRIYWNRHAQVHGAYTKWIVNARQQYCPKCWKSAREIGAKCSCLVFDTTSSPFQKADIFIYRDCTDKISKSYTFLCVTFGIAVCTIKFVFIKCE